MDHLIALTHICDSETFAGFGIGKNITDADLIREMDYISIKLNDSLHYCEWHSDSKSKHCPELFQPILTEEGFCFTFNALNSRDIYSEV